MLLVLLPVGALSACANTFAEEMRARHFFASPPLPRARIDVAASEVILRGPFVNQGHTCVLCTKVEELRPEMARAIESYLDTEVPASILPQPARFRLVAEVKTSTWNLLCWGAPYLPPFSFLGIPCGSSSASVTLELQIGTRRWISRANASLLYGLYYNSIMNIHQNTNQAVLARATVQALKQIVTQARGEGPTV